MSAFLKTVVEAKDLHEIEDFVNRAVGPSGLMLFTRFNIGDINTHEAGKVCEACWNHFGKTLSLTSEWKEYRILFTDTRQMDGWGKPRPAAITPSKLYNLDSKMGPGQTFDFSVDDMAFLACR